MFAQLFQSGSGFWKCASGLNIILMVSLLVLEVNAWRRWANQALESDDEPISKRSRPVWPLRPSNLLVLLGVGITFYSAVQHPPLGDQPLIGISAMLFCLAFVVRHWEREALRKADESGRDQEKGDDLPRQE
jgi:hypothetical protein